MIFPETPIIIAMNLNTTENSRTSLGTVKKGTIVFVELYLPYCSYPLCQYNDKNAFKFEILSLFRGISVASRRENYQNYIKGIWIFVCIIVGSVRGGGGGQHPPNNCSRAISGSFPVDF
jgi:hypothetical protein